MLPTRQRARQGTFDGQGLTERLTDRIRLQQEDPPHDALRPQGFRCQQRYATERKPQHSRIPLMDAVADVDLLLMHNATFAAEYVHQLHRASYIVLTVPPGSPTLYQHESASKSSPGRSRSVSRLPTARPASRPSRRWVRIFTLGRGIQGVSLISYDLNGKAFHPLRLTVPFDTVWGEACTSKSIATCYCGMTKDIKGHEQ